MTVRENVEYGLKLRKVAKRKRSERVEAALETVHLPHTSDRYPSSLSGGEQQRISLARAAVLEPRVLLLDEPLSSLDARLRIEMRAEIRRIQRELGITMLFVTHDQEEALSMSDRVVVMRSGKVEQEGTPFEIYYEPKTEAVAQFIGEINVVRVSSGAPVGSDTRRCETLSGEPLTAMGSSVPDGAQCNLLIRPEAIEIRGQHGQPSEECHNNRLSATLLEVATVGPNTVYTASLRDGTTVTVVSREMPWATRSADMTIGKPGSEVYLTWPVQAGRLF